MKRSMFLIAILLLPHVVCGELLPGAQPLTGTNDLADVYMTGLDRFALNATRDVIEQRAAKWREVLEQGGVRAVEWLTSNRAELARITGVIDKRVTFDAPEVISSVNKPGVLGESATHTLLPIRWPVVGDYMAEGLLLEPKSGKVQRNIVHLPHGGVTPEQILGIGGKAPEAAQTWFVFPARDCRMVLPVVVGRDKERRLSDFPNIYAANPQGVVPNGRVMSAREFVYRPAYVMGRHIIGYELQAVMSLLDWFKRDTPDAPISVEGWGDGGMLALFVAALDERVDQSTVSGYFGARTELWQEPPDRNLFGYLRSFGDAEVAALIAPRKLVVVAVDGPRESVTREKGDGGGAGALWPQTQGDVTIEVARARALAKALGHQEWLARPDVGSLAAAGAKPLHDGGFSALAVDAAAGSAREQRLVKSMNALSQRLIDFSPVARADFLSRLDFTSPTAYEHSAEHYRNYYRENIMGRIHATKSVLNLRSRLIEESDKYLCHEVVLDVLPDFILEGYLLVPKGLRPGERRPLVVVQHGRGGTPRTTIALKQGGRPTYGEISPRLANEGYLVFAPQNPYVFEDRYRQLVRKLNPLGWTLYSLIHCQYEQMFVWFTQLPFVDMQRVAFIGQSYGGKTAVRVPPVMPQFALTICTGDFNEGVVKMASTRYPFSFALLDEYEMFEFGLGKSFNYGDLAALAAPKPFMAQRGHSDGVAWDEFVGYEYARVLRLYTRIGLPQNSELYWFKGGHEIAVDAAIKFLGKFLRD